MGEQKRVVAIHDISCVGKCSLTVALPILSAGGIECAVLPTAILSTHTGGFANYTYRDLTSDINPIKKHWKSLDLSFDAIYTGFLGSFEQLKLVKTLFEDFKTKDNLIFVDPAMADFGKLYPIFDEKFAKGMVDLCKMADIIVPNMTEAALLLDFSYTEPPYTKDYVGNILKELSALGPKMVVLTGIAFDDKQLGAAAYDSLTGKISYYLSEKIDGHYHGTGDIYASVLLTAIMNNISLENSLALAVDFTVNSIKRTADAGTDVRFGVDFEHGISKLCKDLETLR